MGAAVVTIKVSAADAGLERLITMAGTIWRRSLGVSIMADAGSDYHGWVRGRRAGPSGLPRLRFALSLKSFFAFYITGNV